MKYIFANAQCPVDQVTEGFRQIIDGFDSETPGRQIKSIEHQTCAIGPVSNQAILLTVIIGYE